MSDILKGDWVQVDNQEAFDTCLSAAQARKGTYQGPGKYLLISFAQRCPRNCCWDEGLELLTYSQVAEKVGDIEDCLRSLLEEGR